MKLKVRLTIATICVGLISTIAYSQEKAPEFKGEIKAFQNISEYSNLKIVEEIPEMNKDFPFQENVKEADNSLEPVFPNDGSREVTSTTTVFHDFRYKSGYFSSDQGVTFSPALYGYYYAYSTQWNPTTFTFPEPAVSVTINTYGYYYGWYYGGVLTAYDENGSYLGHVYPNYWYWGNLTYTAPAGQKIGSIVMQNINNQYYSWYTQYMWVTYENNQAPVAIAQDITTNTVSNCQADVSAAQINNGSYDPDGDPLTFSVSPAGPYSLGTTNVTLTVSDGELSSTAYATVTVNDITPPVADLATLPDVTGECDATISTVPTATDNCSGSLTATTEDDLYYDQQGTYTVTWTFDDGNGNVITQLQNVIVDDITVPVITATADPITLWPPNHTYQTVNVSECFTAVFDNCASLSNSDVKIVKVTSDEDEDANGGGDGNTTDDMVIASDCKSVDLRKERQGNGNGRVYTIHMEIDDGNGNTGTATYEVYVPKNKNGNAVNDGVAYEVTSSCSAKSAAIAFDDEIVENASMKTYPNPANTTAIVEFTSSESKHTTVAVYNSMGLKVAILFDGIAEAGQTNSLVFEASHLAKGLYYIRLQSGNSVNKVNKLILTR